ncbi:MFS general substrate transporter [Polychaeton citri CBS 116435]|uniref:MFS general substrate transporter n=1 Tax=Polychaeton citri CBS 116435 TaxID=1314669 RepID=A0A9P4Q7C1_9PEZI|nr:MFS general substrate transporter [Polychaeton citri CBS 116435]
MSGRYSFTPGELTRPYPEYRVLHLAQKDNFAASLPRYGVAANTGNPLTQQRTASEVFRQLYPRYTTPHPTALEPLNSRTAWLHALTGFFVIFNCWGLPNSWGVLQDYYEHYHLPHEPASTIAWIGSTQLALVFGLGVPVGRLVDSGYFRPLFHCGSVLSVLAIFMSSFCMEWWSLWLTQGLLVGLGMGMVFCSGIVALMTWFDETRIAGAMGLGAAGSCVGVIVYVLILRHFLASSGFATTMRIIGGVAAVTIMPANLVYRKAPEASIARSTTLRSPLSPAYLLVALGLFFAFLGVYFGFVYLVNYSVTVLHLSDTAATNLLIFMLAANLPGRFVPALISDRCIGPLNTIIPATVLSSLSIWIWTASSSRGSSSKSSLTIVACFYGFVSAGIQVLYAPVVYSFCIETNTERDRSFSKTGGIFTLVGIACLVGTPIGGALISYRLDKGMDHPYLGAQCFAGTSLLLGGILLFFSRVAKAGWGRCKA